MSFLSVQHPGLMAHGRTLAIMGKKTSKMRNHQLQLQLEPPHLHSLRSLRSRKLQLQRLRLRRAENFMFTVVRIPEAIKAYEMQIFVTTP